MEIILKYFPDLSEEQTGLLKKLKPLYDEWNQKINLISRKDMDHFYTKHVLHSLFIAKIVRFLPDTKILDVGTGGGFPGIPLAIIFPECRFTLVDSIGKKIMVVNEVVKTLGLKNVVASQQRAEKGKGRFDFIVSRAVTNLPEFMGWIHQKIDNQNKNPLKNGVLYLKGGDFSEELSRINYDFNIYNIADYFNEDYFETKKLVHVFKI